jgi:D-alanine-D-alanine ligase
MKKNIAIVWGGYSSEIIVSEKSMTGIYSFMDKDRYNVYKVKVDKQGWSADTGKHIYPVDKNDFSFYCTDCQQKIVFDFAYITIHGTPGEDGRLQGYFDMLDIPYSTCGMMASALTFNKFICNKFLKNFGIRIANSYILRENKNYNPDEIINNLKLPVFVKPNIGGSSFATTKVKKEEDFSPAIDKAFEEAPEVIIESFVKGREVTCGCYKTDEKITVLPITEVITSNEFFDYKAKYEGEVQEITPADLTEKLTDKVQRLTLEIYNLIGAKGIIRVDYIIPEDNNPVLLEVNTTPGMTQTSFIPQQVAAAGLNMTDVLSEIIENEF